METQRLPVEVLEQGGYSLLAVDVATLVVTACTIFVAGALAIIAFYLNRDFREQMRATRDQGILIDEIQTLAKATEARIDRNVARDNLMTRVVFDIMGDLINAEKIGRFAAMNSVSEEISSSLDSERNRFFGQITRRVRELSFILADRDDKKSQILSEIVAEEADRSTVEFLEALIEIETDEIQINRLRNARTISAYKCKIK